MSAIAAFMAEKGHIIAGSDRAFDLSPGHPLKKILQAKNILIVPQDGSGLNGTFDCAVFSTAVESDQPETVRARELGIPVKTRPEFLTEITEDFDTIAVSGTSGKSTASGLLAFLMDKLGLKPNFIGGGRVKQFKTASDPGNALAGRSDYLIIEACESDGSVVNYRPKHSIILNLSLDHHAIDITAGMFETLIRHTKEHVIINADDMHVEAIPKGEAVTFSIHAPSDFRAEKVRHKPFSTDFTVQDANFTLSLPGEYNLYNALSCIALLTKLGVPLRDLAPLLPEFKGIDRRFDIHLNEGGYLVIDDYAHNPHKISALMEAAQRIRPRICYIFQPHGFAPTRMMKQEYIETFLHHLRDSDHLILLPIFYAGGTAAQDISSKDLADEIRKAGKSAVVVNSREDVLAKVNEWETYIVFGARDESLSDFAREIVQKCNSAEVPKL